MSGVIEGLWRMSVGSVELFLLFLDEGAFTCSIPLVLAVDAAIWDLLPSIEVVAATPIVVAASIAPPSSSIVVRPEVARSPEAVFMTFVFFAGAT